MTHEFNGRPHYNKKQTWTTDRIVVIVTVALIYGVWFNFIDSLNYCYNENSICKSVGDMFGGNLKYQPWNIFGHIIPGLFMLLYFRSKKEELAIVELFIVGILVSTATMDSPLWGAIRLLHGTPLWHRVDTPVPPHDEPTTGPAFVQFGSWVSYYYNPIGSYGVWGDSFPTAATLFWSVVGRIAGAVILIIWQFRQEKMEAPASTIKDLVYRLGKSNSSKIK